MTVGLRDHVPELGRLPLLFRETFRDRPSVEANGATLVGTGTTFSDGLVLNGSGNLTYAVRGSKIFRPAFSYALEFTLGFDPSDGVERYMFSEATPALASRTSIRIVGGAIYLYFSASLLLGIAWAIWGPLLVAGKNRLVVTAASGATTAWLNGTQIGGTSVAAWTFYGDTVGLRIGSNVADGQRFIGTIHSFEIYGNVATSTDEPHLRDGSVVSDIDLDKCLAYLPGKSYYRNDAGLFVTDVGGRIGGTALMGSDGATATQFPKVAREAGLVRGFSFDGGDQINLGDDDRYSFTDGAADKPFSLAALVQIADLSTFRAIICKATSVTVGEYLLYMNVGGRLRLMQVDNTTTGYIYHDTTILMTRAITFIAATSDGTGINGMRIYINDVRANTTTGSAGAYSRMRNTAVNLTVGSGGGTFMNGNVVLSSIWDEALSPLQLRALRARLLRLARTP